MRAWPGLAAARFGLGRAAGEFSQEGVGEFNTRVERRRVAECPDVVEPRPYERARLVEQTQKRVAMPNEKRSGFDQACRLPLDDQAQVEQVPRGWTIAAEVHCGMGRVIGRFDETSGNLSARIPV